MIDLLYALVIEAQFELELKELDYSILTQVRRTQPILAENDIKVLKSIEFVASL